METNQINSERRVSDRREWNASSSFGDASVCEAADGKNKVIQRDSVDMYQGSLIPDSRRMETSGASVTRGKFRIKVARRTCICRVCKTEFVGIKWHKKGKLRYTLDFTRTVCSKECRRELGFRGGRSGHKGYRRGEGINSNKLTAEQVMQIRKRADSGEVLRRLAEGFHVRPTTITNIVKGNTWRHLPFAKTAGETRIGRNGNLHGSALKRSILNDETARAIKQRLASGMKKSVIAKELGVAKTFVYNIAYNDAWKHVTI